MYESFYRLSAKPFRLSPDPKFYYTSRTHQRALAYLRYGLHQGEGFVVLTGEPGTGKTLMVRTLLAEVPPREWVVGTLVTTQLAPDDLLTMVADSFGLPMSGSKGGLLHTLQSGFLRVCRDGRRALLLVDEAHNLPPASFEELRMLTNWHSGDHPLLQVVLLGQPPLRDLLGRPDMEQFRQRVLVAHHLQPLAAAELSGYVEHRLRCVDWVGDPAFTPAAFHAIHHFSGGVPRRVNTLCERLLLFGGMEGLHQIDEQVVRAVVDEMNMEFGGELLNQEPPPPPPREETFTAATPPAARPEPARTSAPQGSEKSEAPAPASPPPATLAPAPAVAPAAASHTPGPAPSAGPPPAPDQEHVPLQEPPPPTKPQVAVGPPPWQDMAGRPSPPEAEEPPAPPRPRRWSGILLLVVGLGLVALWSAEPAWLRSIVAKVAPHAASPAASPAALPQSGVVAPRLALSRPSSSGRGVVPVAHTGSDGPALPGKPVEALLDRFIDIYRRGDPQALMALFDQDVTVNQSRDRGAIASAYEQLFAATESRRIEISDIAWRRTGADELRGEGRFAIVVSESQRRPPQTFSGRITLGVSHAAGAPRISYLDYDYDRKP